MPQIPADQSAVTMTASDADLHRALEEANLPTLLLVLRQFTGSEEWLRDPYVPSRTVATDDNDDGGFSPAVASRIREAALEVLTQWRDGHVGTPQPPRPQDIPGLLSFSLGEPVPGEYAESLAEEVGFASREPRWTDQRPDEADDFKVVIIGAGLAGIAMAVTLGRLGIPYVILEKNAAAGGVWFNNTYPGAGVDTPSHLYSYSFAPRRDWSRYYARQGEILDYIQRTARDFGVAENVEYAAEVETALWHEESASWTVTYRTGGAIRQVDASVVISCVGILNRPSIPDLPGMDLFTGAMFHSSEWDHDLDLDGKRVAVIGTGATSMQVVPAIVDTVEKVLVFQRSPQWVAPNPNYLRDVSDAVRLLMEQVPFYASFYRARLIWMFQDKLLPTLRRDPEWPHQDRSINAINEKHRLFFTRYVDQQLGERADLRDKVLPTYPPYGKRILMDNRWLQTVQREEVELITDAVAGFDAGHVVTATGETYAADVVVLATGFHSSRMLSPMTITGREGKVLNEVWHDEDPFAYLGIGVPDFPNFFIVGGPNTALGHGGSAIFPAECGVSYIAQLLVTMLEQNLRAVAVKESVCAEYNERLEREHDQLIWTHQGTSNWYRNSRGRVTAVTPWRGVDYWQMTRRPDLDDYVVDVKEPAVETS